MSPSPHPPPRLPAWWRLPAPERTASSSGRPELAPLPGWKTPSRLRNIHKKEPRTLGRSSTGKKPRSPRERGVVYPRELRAYSAWKTEVCPPAASPWWLWVRGLEERWKSELVAERRKKNFKGKLLLQLCSSEYVCPCSPVRVSTISSGANHRSSVKSPERTK